MSSRSDAISGAPMTTRPHMARWSPSVVPWPSTAAGATLYTSGEPCAMCMGAVLWCQFGRLVYAASVEQLSTRLHQILISSVELRGKAPFVAISITGGVLADEAMALFPR